MTRPFPDDILAAAKAICEAERTGDEFAESTHGGSQAAVFREDGRMLVESDHASGGEPTVKATLTPSVMVLVAAARELDGDE